MYFTERQREESELKSTTTKATIDVEFNVFSSTHSSTRMEFDRLSMKADVCAQDIDEDFIIDESGRHIGTGKRRLFVAHLN